MPPRSPRKPAEPVPSKKRRQAAQKTARSGSRSAGKASRSDATVPALPVAEAWPVGRLVPYVRNPRRNDPAVDRMVRTLDRFGWRYPILARSTGGIIDGHLRLKAALARGDATVPVAIADDMTETEVRAFRLAVNRSATWAEWDDEALGLELHDLQDAGEDLAATGFDDDELARILAGPEVGPGDVGDGEPGDEIPPDRYREQFGVIVICEDEAHQRRVYEELSSAGHSCRVVVT